MREILAIALLLVVSGCATPNAGGAPDYLLMHSDSTWVPLTHNESVSVNTAHQLHGEPVVVCWITHTPQWSWIGSKSLRTVHWTKYPEEYEHFCFCFTP